VSVTLGPKEEAGNGSFVWDLTLPNGVDNPTLYVTTLDNHALSGGTITLTAGQHNQGTLSLASGYYKARLELTMGSKVAGFSSEFIHIYGGLTSTLAKVFTADDFVEVKTVDDFNLTGYFPAPVWGAAPQTLFEGSQYNGAIQWKNGGLTHSGAFAADTAYTAMISLTAKTGHTFDGVGANCFSHSGSVGTNAANSGNVTIVFNKTAATGGINIDIGFNHGEIEVSGSDGVNLIEHFNQPNTLTLSVSGYKNISWYIDSGTTAVQGNPLTLRGIDYTMGNHFVTFNGYKDGVPFSQMIPFRVVDTSFSLTSIQAAELYLSNIGDNSAENPAVLPLELDLSGGGWQNLLTVIAAAGKYVSLDLSLSTIAGMEFDPVSTVSTGKDRIVSIVLPNGAQSIKAGYYHTSTEKSYTFEHFTSLKRVDGGSIVNIGDRAFTACTALTTANFPAATTIGYSAFSACTALTTANFPAATTIDGTAFFGCDALTTANFPAATSIGMGAFSYCIALTTADFPLVTSIGDNAFGHCNALTTVSLPVATSIGNEAFRDCEALTTANFPAATSVGRYAFRDCEALITANFPSATTIGMWAFDNCSALTSVSAPLATTIDNYAFTNCDALTTANFPSAASIGEQAFGSCEALTTANFPSATTIGMWAFDNCSALTTANFPAATTISSSAFNNCTNITAITINGACTISIYQADAGRFLDFVTFYTGNGTQAGTYTYADGVWTKN
jgi:hypothetical protein